LKNIKRRELRDNKANKKTFLSPVKIIDTNWITIDGLTDRQKITDK